MKCYICEKDFKPDKMIGHNCINIDGSAEMNNNDERLCNCGDCRYCNAYLSSEDDYEGEGFTCSTCNGGGCTRCEE